MLKKVKIILNGNYSKEKVLGLLVNHFGNKYSVYKSDLLDADIMIKQTGFVGIAVKLKKAEHQTIISIWPASPSAFSRMFLTGFVLFSGKAKEMLNEVSGFFQDFNIDESTEHKFVQHTNNDEAEDIKLRIKKAKRRSVITWAIYVITLIGGNLLMSGNPETVTETAFLISTISSFIWIISWIISIIFAVKLAKRLNRSAWLWAFLTLVLCIISVPVLSFLKRKPL